MKRFAGTCFVLFVVLLVIKVPVASSDSRDIWSVDVGDRIVYDISDAIYEIDFAKTKAETYTSKINYFEWSITYPSVIMENTSFEINVSSNAYRIELWMPVPDDINWKWMLFNTNFDSRDMIMEIVSNRGMNENTVSYDGSGRLFSSIDGYDSSDFPFIELYNSSNFNMTCYVVLRDVSDVIFPIVQDYDHVSFDDRVEYYDSNGRFFFQDYRQFVFKNAYIIPIDIEIRENYVQEEEVKIVNGSTIGDVFVSYQYEQEYDMPSACSIYGDGCQNSTAFVATYFQTMTSGCIDTEYITLDDEENKIYHLSENLMGSKNPVPTRGNVYFSFMLDDEQEFPSSSHLSYPSWLLNDTLYKTGIYGTQDNHKTLFGYFEHPLSFISPDIEKEERISKIDDGQLNIDIINNTITKIDVDDDRDLIYEYSYSGLSDGFARSLIDDDAFSVIYSLTGSDNAGQFDLFRDPIIDHDTSGILPNIFYSNIEMTINDEFDFDGPFLESFAVIPTTFTLSTFSFLNTWNRKFFMFPTNVNFSTKMLDKLHHLNDDYMGINTNDSSMNIFIDPCIISSIDIDGNEFCVGVECSWDLYTGMLVRCTMTVIYLGLDVCREIYVSLLDIIDGTMVYRSGNVNLKNILIISSIGGCIGFISVAFVLKKKSHGTTMDFNAITCDDEMMCNTE